MEAICVSSWGTWEAFESHVGRLGTNFYIYIYIYMHIYLYIYIHIYIYVYIYILDVQMGAKATICARSLRFPLKARISEPKLSTFGKIV